MNFEKTMQFILETQAQMEATAAKNKAASNRRIARIERALTQTSRVVAGLASSDISVRGHIRRHEKRLARHKVLMVGIGNKLHRIGQKLDRMGGRLSGLNEYRRQRDQGARTRVGQAHRANSSPKDGAAAG